MQNDREFIAFDYSKYDKQAKDHAIALLRQYGWTAQENPDRYGIDLLAQKGERSIEVEVEYKNCRSLQLIKRNGLHISERKAKLYMDPETHHMTFMDEFRIALMVKHGALQNFQTVEKPCMRGGRQLAGKFIEIPFDRVRVLQRRTIADLWTEEK